MWRRSSATGFWRCSAIRSPTRTTPSARRLSIQRALAELNRKNAGTGKPELSARIGLETGPAVVDAVGEIYGDVANLAARVQALAEPGTVLVTARVQRQIAGLFVAEERGTHALKGVPEPTVLFKLVRASGAGRRSAQRNLTPLVGRDDEMAMLLLRWERARQGDGQLVMIVGEPGLGKSRLIEEFHARLSDTPHTWVEWSCSQLLQNTPLHPIAEWGRQRFGGADVPAERRLTDLESSLAQVKFDPAENASLLAPLLDIPLPAGRAPALAPEELRRRQLAALTNWVMAGARVQPVVLAFEDLHWADPTTLDVLRAIAERGAQVPLLIVATTRPEFRPPWSMRSHHGTISLAPLDRGQVRDMVADLSGRHALPKEVIDDVAARTGGVPLFVEEVTRLLLERGAQGGIQAIPPTLQQSLMARLDRLGPAREVAQVGSVIGRGFSYALLRDVAGLEDAPLQAALEKLAEADILLVQGAPPESDYRFKHALIQDAAYENLLKSRRQVLHRRVAEILRGDRFAATAAAEPEVLAHHFTQAGMTDAAIEWWGKAGDQALRRSAFQEATAHLGKAIEMADKAAGAAAPQGSDRLRLQISYGNALISARGYGAQETTAAFARARELVAQAEDAADRFSAYYGLWVGPFTRGELVPMREVVEALLRDCESQPKSPEAGIAHRLAGTTNWYAGDFEEARVHLEHALAIFDPQRDRDLAYRFGHDVGVAEMAYLAMVRWSLGEIDRARRLAEEMVTQAIQTGHIPTVVYGHMHMPFSSSCAGIPPGLRLMSRRSSTWRASMRCRIGSLTAVSLSPGRVGIWPVETAALRICARPSRCSGSRELPFTRSLWKPCWPRLRRKKGNLKPPTQRWIAPSQRQSGLGTVGSKPRPIASAVRYCSSAIRRTRLGRGRLPHRHRGCATAEGAKLRAARRLCTGEALSVDRPRRRRPRRARARARRLFADAGIPGD